MSEITLRPYQVEAGAAIRQQWEEGRRRTLLVLPTGLGKTVVLSKVAEEDSHFTNSSSGKTMRSLDSVTQSL